MLKSTMYEIWLEKMQWGQYFHGLKYTYVLLSWNSGAVFWAQNSSNLWWNPTLSLILPYLLILLREGEIHEKCWKIHLLGFVLLSRVFLRVKFTVEFVFRTFKAITARYCIEKSKFNFFRGVLQRACSGVPPNLDQLYLGYAKSKKSKIWGFYTTHVCY